MYATNNHVPANAQNMSNQTRLSTCLPRAWSSNSQLSAANIADCHVVRLVTLWFIRYFRTCGPSSNRLHTWSHLCMSTHPFLPANRRDTFPCMCPLRKTTRSKSNCATKCFQVIFRTGILRKWHFRKQAYHSGSSGHPSRLGAHLSTHPEKLRPAFKAVHMSSNIQ